MFNCFKSKQHTVKVSISTVEYKYGDVYLIFHQG